MKMRRNCVRILACVGLCLGFMGTGLAAEGMDFPVVYESEENIGNSQIAAFMNQIVSVSDWKRRIYQAVYSVDTFEGDVSAIRAYAGANFHFTDSQGNILSEGTYIDKSGNISADFTGGEVCRDANGWYILWKSPDMNVWQESRAYIQADSDFEGGNNQTLGVKGMSGIYLKENSPAADAPFNTSLVNVAVEVEALDVNLPVMKGTDTSDADFLRKAGVKLYSIYGELSELPLKARWYRVTPDGEQPVGEVMTGMPYRLPADAAKALSEPGEYVLKMYYNGEVSEKESLLNSSSYENIVSEDVPMAKASLKSETISGRIYVTVQLEQRPYQDGETAFHNFRFKLYRFDSPNQVITDSTPYTEYALGFETASDEARKQIEIGDLEEGWYTLVPEIPESYYAENEDQRTDNCYPYARTGGSAGVDFHIGEIIDNQYSWETIRYQGQDTPDPLGDNFFKVNYTYRETVYPVNYKNNLPEGAELKGQEPADTAKYVPGNKVSVLGSNGMTADGWQFAGWSAEAGDGIYSEGEEIYSDRPVHNISAEKQAVMTEGGLTLYGQWIPVYTVTYHGNTSTGGSVPVDGSGTVYPGENIYYSGDSVTVQPAGNLEKTDADGTRYVFDGWCLNQDGSGRRLNSGDRILVEDGDVNLYAMWKTVSADRYAVNYIASLPEGSRMTGVLPNDGEKYEAGSNVTVQNQGTIALEHYRFAGWSLKSREDALYQPGEEIYGTKDIGKTVTKNEAVMVEEGLYFYSRWIPLYQVVYHANAGAVEGLPKDENEYEANQMVEILSGEKMLRTGYQFMGWNTKRDGSGQSYDAGMKFNMLSENIELYAQWKKLPETESESESESWEETDRKVAWPLIILAVIGAACIIAYVVYQCLSHKKF